MRRSTSTGGIGTLKYYARLGAPLGDAKALVDDKPVRLAKAENFQAIHLLVPRRGVAVHTMRDNDRMVSLTDDVRHQLERAT
jgi:hypothetical protein